MKDLPTREVATFEAVTEQIIGIVEAEVGAKDLSADSTLQSGGPDSLKVVSVIFKIEARYDICLDDEDADDVRTVGDLAAVVVRRIEEQL
jgi:acyl carrier protein